MLPVFGPGAIFLQRTDIANGTPVNIGKANEFQLDQQFSKKELYGQGQFPLFVARGTAKFTAKAKAALVSGMAINSAMYGGTLSAGSQTVALSESHAISSGSLTVTNGTAIVSDLGVIYASTGLPLDLATSAPGEGSYEVNLTTGVYTFNTADNTKGVFVTYTYNQPSTGQSMLISSQLIGFTPTFKAWYYTFTNNLPLCIELNACVSDKLNFGMKLEEFMYPELDFSCFADASGNVGTFNYGEVS